MASEVDICNAALIRVGDKTISALSASGNREARLCFLRYPMVRDALVSAHPWNFAQKRDRLARLSAAPTFDYSYAYQLPADCLRVIGIDDTISDWRVEGRTVVTDLSEVYALYLAKITDTTLMPPYFVDALGLALAVELAYALKPSASFVEGLIKERELKLARARAMDAQEGYPERLEHEDDWLNSRRTSGTVRYAETS